MSVIIGGMSIAQPRTVAQTEPEVIDEVYDVGTWSARETDEVNEASEVGKVIGVTVGTPINPDRIIPPITQEDNGKFLRVVNGVWQAVALIDVRVEGL